MSPQNQSKGAASNTPNQDAKTKKTSKRKSVFRSKYYQEAVNLLEDNSLTQDQLQALQILIKINAKLFTGSGERHISQIQEYMKEKGYSPEIAKDAIPIWKDFGFTEGNNRLRFRVMECTQCHQLVSRIPRQRKCYYCKQDFCDQCGGSNHIPTRVLDAKIQSEIDSIWVCESCFSELKKVPTEVSTSSPNLKEYCLTKYNIISPVYLKYEDHWYHKNYRGNGYTTPAGYLCDQIGNHLPILIVAGQEKFSVNPHQDFGKFIRSLYLSINRGDFGFRTMKIWLFEQIGTRNKQKVLRFRVLLSEPGKKIEPFKTRGPIPVCTHCDLMILEEDLGKTNCPYCGSSLQIKNRQNKAFLAPMVVNPQFNPHKYWSNEIFVQLGLKTISFAVETDLFLANYQLLFANGQIGPYQLHFTDSDIYIEPIIIEDFDDRESMLFPEDLIPE